MPDRSALPNPAPLADWLPPRPETWRLPNGLRVWFVEQGPAPLVSAILVFPAGSGTDPVGKSGLTALMADLLDEGAAGRTALELSDELKRLATGLSTVADVDSTMLSMDLMADTLEPSFALLADVAQRPTLDPAELVRRRDHRIAQAIAGESEPDTVRSIVLRRALFGDGYGGEIPRGTRRSLPKLTAADVNAHYRKVVQPDRAELVVVGGIDRASVAAVVERHFGAWTGKMTAQELPLSPGGALPAIHLADFPAAAQSTIAVAMRAPGASDPEYFPALIHNRAFGGAFSSRLNLNLREEKGYTYGARSLFFRFRRAGMFAAIAAVKTEHTRSSIDETLRELDEMQRERPLEPKEVEEAVSGLLLGFPGRFERTGGVAAEVANLPTYGWGEDWLTNWPDRLRAVTIESARAIATRYCDPKAMDLVVIGDRAKVEPELAGLGRKIFVYDAQGGIR
ncbi:MAG: insulinase family protein [Polyangiaceae bacterium]|nr:insulinase family protein [Polyangiaceae bacterium]